MTIASGRKYQTRNGRMVVISKIVDGPLDGSTPAYGEGKIMPLTPGQDEGADRWSLTGSYKNGTLGVPHTFDLVHDAGAVAQ